MTIEKSGPLRGVKVVEIAGIGPAPMCGVILADMGADVILVERKSTNPNAALVDDSGKQAFYKRGKRSVKMNLKHPDAIAALLKLVANAEVLIEGFRPGVMERLGLGPDICLNVNPKLVFGRMTGWGQTGPLAHAAGHDINFVGVGGSLYYSGNHGEPPFSPSTVMGDVGAGSMSLALGLVCALLNSRATGVGQVVDAAISDGTAYQSLLLAFLRASGSLSDGPRGESFLTAGAPWYNSYETSDNHYISVGALEPDFYRQLIEACGFKSDPDFANQWDKNRWPAGKAKFSTLFKSQTRAHWCELLEGTDVCFGPVLNLAEAASHPHNIARNTFVEIDGFVQPAPAPKFSSTPAQAGQVHESGADVDIVLAEVGYSQSGISLLRDAGAI